jgi:hypothetical protein
MPSTSKKQHNFMEAIAHSPSFAKKVGVPQSVGFDFAKADKGRKFAKGGDMATKGMNPFTRFEKSGKDVETKGKGKEGSKKEEAFDKSQMGMKRGGTAMYQSFSDSGKPAGMKPVQKMAGGGQIDPRMAAMLAAKTTQGASQRSADPRIAAMLAAKASPARQAVDPRAAVLAAKLRNSAPMKKGGMAKFSAGGFTSAADGVARKGKTKATQIKMKSGGGC